MGPMGSGSDSGSMELMGVGSCSGSLWTNGLGLGSGSGYLARSTVSEDWWSLGGLTGRDLGCAGPIKSFWAGQDMTRQKPPSISRHGRKSLIRAQLHRLGLCRAQDTGLRSRSSFNADVFPKSKQHVNKGNLEPGIPNLKSKKTHRTQHEAAWQRTEESRGLKWSN